ncbi:MAG: nucleotide exchange factor GrpE [bacterium]
MENPNRNPPREIDSLAESRPLRATGTEPLLSGPSLPEAAPGEETLLAAARDWLLHLREPEPRPEGVVTAEETAPAPDLYTLLEALTALRQEIALQGRGFQRLEQAIQHAAGQWEAVPALAERFSAFHAGLEDLQSLVELLTTQTLAGERKRGYQSGKEKAFASLAEPLLDTHDQLRRWLEQHQNRPPSRPWWRRWLAGADATGELIQTITLCHKKLGQRLNDLGITPIARPEMEFDPTKMKAVDRAEIPGASGVSVVEVYRQGYLHEDRVLRFAEVKVACPAGEPSETSL